MGQAVKQNQSKCLFSSQISEKVWKGKNTIRTTILKSATFLQHHPLPTGPAWTFHLLLLTSELVEGLQRVTAHGTKGHWDLNSPSPLHFPIYVMEVLHSTKTAETKSPDCITDHDPAWVAPARFVASTSVKSYWMTRQQQPVSKQGN